MSSRSELILLTYLCLCMITMPPLLSAGEMMISGFESGWIVPVYIFLRVMNRLVERQR